MLVICDQSSGPRIGNDQSSGCLSSLTTVQAPGTSSESPPCSVLPGNQPWQQIEAREVGVKNNLPPEAEDRQRVCFVPLGDEPLLPLVLRQGLATLSIHP